MSSVLAMIRAHTSHYQIQSTKFIAYFMIMRIHTMYTCIQSYSYFTVYCVHYTHHNTVRIVCKRPAAHKHTWTHTKRDERMCVNYNYLIFLSFGSYDTENTQRNTLERKYINNHNRFKIHTDEIQKQQISSVERAIIRWQKERQKH